MGESLPLRLPFRRGQPGRFSSALISRWPASPSAPSLCTSRRAPPEAGYRPVRAAPGPPPLRASRGSATTGSMVGVMQSKGGALEESVCGAGDGGPYCLGGQREGCQGRARSQDRHGRCAVAGDDGACGFAARLVHPTGADAPASPGSAPAAKAGGHVQRREEPATQGAGGRGHSHQRAGGRHPRTERASQGRSPDCGPVHARGARSQGSAASELASGVASDQATTRAPASAKPGASARATPGSEGCCESSPRLQHEHAAHSRPRSTR